MALLKEILTENIGAQGAPMFFIFVNKILKKGIKQLTYHRFCDKLYKHVLKKYVQSHR